MNRLADGLIQTILIVFLLILTILVFTILIDYLRFLWARHKTKKEMIKAFREAENKDIKVTDEENQELMDLINRIMKENGIDVNEIEEIDGNE